MEGLVGQGAGEPTDRQNFIDKSRPFRRKESPNKD